MIKTNRVRKVLILFNILFILIGMGFFAFFVPALNTLVVEDAKQELINNVPMITSAIRENKIKGNYGLTVYTIPRDGNRKLKTDMYSFYIISETGKLLYSSDPKVVDDINYREYSYIDNAFTGIDNSGDTIGIKGNEIHYISTKIAVRSSYYSNSFYLVLYEIDKDKIRHDVYTLLSFFAIGFAVSSILIIILSWWINKQYRTILNYQIEVVEAYELLDNTGEITEPHLSRIKKILHSFAFTTAILFAINKDGITIFRNRATLDAQKEMFGTYVPLYKTPDNSNWAEYRNEWEAHVYKMLTTTKNYLEWSSRTYNYRGEVVYTKNRIKKIIVDNEPVLICEIQDMTDINLANEEISRYTEYLFTIFNTVRDIIIVTDYIGTIRNANQSLQEILGYELEEVFGKNIETILKSDCQKISHNHFICNGIKKDGTIIKCEVYQNTLMLQGEPGLQLLVIEDITESELLKEQLYNSIAVTTDTMKTLAGNL